MSRNLLLIFALASNLLTNVGWAQIQTFDPVETRAKLLELRDNPILQKFEVSGEFSSVAQQKFVNFYKYKILPEEAKLIHAYYKYRGVSLLIDAGSYENDAELSDWQKQMQEAVSVFSESEVSEKWTATLKEWAALAEGLTGELPDEARRQWMERERDVYPREAKERLDELNRLQSEFDVAVNTAPSAGQALARMYTENSNATRSFKAGEITFQEAQKIITDNYAKGGGHFVAFEAIQKLPDHLNRAAVIRSELAKIKGYTTWSQMQLATDLGYIPQYRGVENQKAFVAEIISNLAPKIRKIMDGRIQELGLDPKTIKAEHEGLVLPQTLSQLRAYYPADKITDIWLETMKESGFKDRELSQILVDAKLRDKKNSTGAYMAPVTSPYVETNVLDAETLNFLVPPKDSTDWKPGFIYIMQNYMIGGTNDARTMYHEGGHALERTLKAKTLATPEAYGYVETPSNTMEYFMSDAQVLFDKAVPLNGKKPSLEEIEKLVQNSNIVTAWSFLETAGSAWFDIELWNYDYSKPGAQTFIERVEFLQVELAKMMLKREHIESPVPQFYSMMSTPHFTSGEVRYIGYVFAELSSAQMADYFYDEVEKSSGRRTWLNQPDLARLFGEEFFSQGWKQPFPENIEKITKRKYEPSVLIENLLSDIGDCAKYLE